MNKSVNFKRTKTKLYLRRVCLKWNTHTRTHTKKCGEGFTQNFYQNKTKCLSCFGCFWPSAARTATRGYDSTFI